MTNAFHCEPHRGARSNVGDLHTRIVDKGQTTSVILATQEGDSSVATAQVPQ